MICPFCKEEIQEGAIKCKHCGSMLSSQGNISATATPAISKTVPPEIKKWNWAAFLWGAIWAIGHRLWLIGLLGFVPVIGFIMQIVLGIKGNEWAWAKGNYTSVEQYRLRQKNWLIAFLIFPIGVAIIGILAAIAIPQFSSYRVKAYNSAAQADLKNFVATLSELSLAHDIDSQDISGEIKLGDNNFIISQNVLLSLKSSSDGQSFIASSKHGKGNKFYAFDSDGSAFYFSHNLDTQLPAPTSNNDDFAEISDWEKM